MDKNRRNRIKELTIALTIAFILTGCMNTETTIIPSSADHSTISGTISSDSSTEDNSMGTSSTGNISESSSAGTSTGNFSQSSTGSSSASSSTNSKIDAPIFAGIPLKAYALPNDGIEYDLTPLKLNEPLKIITRNLDKLYDGSREFRFISINAPTLLDCSQWEQEDQIKSIAQMGGQVTRSYTFSVNTIQEGTSASSGKYILGIGNYNETAFKRLDHLLAICNKYGIRVIIPFIDPYEYNGGIPAFNDMHGNKTTGENSLILNAATFYSNTAIKTDFFNFVRHILNRKNTVTGIYYKDDPAILAWESGNEMPYYNEAAPYYNPWIKELIQVIKSIDKKHLIMDGSAFGVRSQSATDPDIDIVTLHMYPQTVSNSYAVECKNFRNYFKNRKPVIIGEFGFVETNVVEDLYDEAILGGTTGTLLWSLREHSENGSFTRHQETAKYWSYHWPGFEAGSDYDELGMLKLTYLKAYEIQGKKPKIIQKPDIPKILEPLKNPQKTIIWRGSTGAYGYDIQRSVSNNGPWTTIGVDVSDDFSNIAVLFADGSEGLIAGKTYYYRIRAKSAGGFSDWSAPVSAIVRNNS